MILSVKRYRHYVVETTYAVRIFAVLKDRGLPTGPSPTRLLSSVWRAESSVARGRLVWSFWGGGRVRDIVGNCVAAADTVSRGDLRLGLGSGGRKGGSPPCLG